MHEEPTSRALEYRHAEIKAALACRMLERYRPYPKQRDFHAAGKPLHVRERLLMAANQVGKTMSAAMEHAMHLTGEYPDWWDGAYFDEPTTGWAASETSQSTRDTVQRLLLGEPGNWGTGAIPRRCLDGDPKRATHGVSDAVETILVKHVSGGTSRVTIKTYDQGRLRWQGETLDFVWFDEEPPEDIYFEGLTRTNARGGIVTLTFTPLKGRSNVVRRFLDEKPAGTVVTTMTIDDAGHYTPEQRAAITATYPAHERDARIKGVPVLGSGRIFPVEESTIVIPPIQIPTHWPRINGIDFGWSHPTAAVSLAWDRDADTVYLVAEYRKSEDVPAVHAAAIKPWGDWIPVAWPHDGLQHDKGSGEELAGQYRKKHGLSMLKDKATHPPKKGEKEGTGGNGVEAGLMEMLERMMTGRWKVFSTCHQWLEEFRMYHRDDGKVVKIDDDVLCLHPDTLVITRAGKRAIADLVGTEGEVLSVGGEWAAFRGCRMTREDAECVTVEFDDGFSLTCTADHLVLMATGEWVEAAFLTGVSCHNAVSHSEGAAWKKSIFKAGDLHALASIGAARANSFIGRCGNIITGQFSRAFTFTTRTATERTTTLPISMQSMGERTYRSTIPGTSADRTPQLQPWLFGGPLKRVGASLLQWATETRFSCMVVARSLANAAAKALKLRLQVQTGFALAHANLNGAVTLAPTASRPLVRHVAQSSWQTSSGRQPAVVVDAAGSNGSRPKQAPSTSRALRVRSAGRSNVFCMEVPGLHAFAVGNGVVVHNCASRYAMMMLRHAIIKPKPAVIETEGSLRILDPSMGY